MPVVMSHGWVRMLTLELAGYLTDLSEVGHTHLSLVMSLGQIMNKRPLRKSLTYQIVVFLFYNLKLSDRKHAFTPHRELCVRARRKCNKGRRCYLIYVIHKHAS